MLLLLLYNITRDAIAHLTHYPLQFTHYCDVWNREQKFPESYKVAKTFRWTDTHTRAVNVYYDDIMMRLSRCSLIVLIKFLCKTISSPLTFSILSRRESNSTCCRYYIEVGGFFQTRCRTLVFTALCFKFYNLTGVIMFQSKVKVTRSQVSICCLICV